MTESPFNKGIALRVHVDTQRGTVNEREHKTQVKFTFHVYLSSSNENGSICFPYWKDESETSESR